MAQGSNAKAAGRRAGLAYLAIILFSIAGYLSSIAYVLILPAVAIVAAIASAFAQVRRAARGAADGKELVQRRIEPARWRRVVAVRAIGFGLAITLGAYYFIGMAVSYTSRTPIHIDRVPARLFAPNKLSRNCELFVVVTVSQTSDSYVCVEHVVGGRHARLSSTDAPSEGKATIDGRSGFLGAVADTISMQSAGIVPRER